MTDLKTYLADDRIRAAVDEMQDRIRAHYPDVEFDLSVGDDPEGIYLTATVDLDDPEEVTDLIIQRRFELQVEEGLPLYIIPMRTRARNLKIYEEYARVKKQRQSA